MRLEQERSGVTRWLGPIRQSVLQVRGPGRRTLAAPERDSLLADAVAGLDRRVVIEAVVFQQTSDAQNRNFVRFKPSILKRFAASFVGQPFLRDHAQAQIEARGGTIVASEWSGDKDTGELRQEIELSAPWAVEAALRGLMDRFSIGWANTDEVICSLCDEPYQRSWFGAFPSCNHMPGDVTEDGDVVEMIVMGAEGIETSAVNTPAVEGTGIESIRAQLAAHRRLATEHSLTIRLEGGALADKETAARRVRDALAAAHREKPMKNLASKLGLAETSDEAAMMAAVDKLAAENEKRGALLAAAAEARANADKEVAALRSELSGYRQTERAAAIDRLVAKVRGKIGPKIGEDGKPILGGTDTEKRILAMAEKDLALAESVADELPQILKPGLATQPTRGKSPPPADVAGLSAGELARAKKLGIEPKYYAQAKAHQGQPEPETEE